MLLYLTKEFHEIDCIHGTFIRPRIAWAVPSTFYLTRISSV